MTTTGYANIILQFRPKVKVSLPDPQLKLCLLLTPVFLFNLVISSIVTEPHSLVKIAGESIIKLINESYRSLHGFSSLLYIFRLGLSSNFLLQLLRQHLQLWLIV